MIEIRGLRKTYRMGDIEVHALQGADLTIEEGDFVAIMGPSGSGKSTMMHILGLLDTPDAGSYKLFGREVSRLSEDELARIRSRDIGFVFQQFNLLSRTSALENVLLPQIYASDRVDTEKGRRLLAEVGLGQRLEHKPSELSGGQQQRVAITRALVNDPRLIFADEPTGNLDSASEKEIMGILHRLNDERGITIVLVTHEPEIARHAKRVIRMRDGKVQSDERLRPVGATPRAAPPAPADERHGLSWLEGLTHLRQAFRALAANKVRTGLSMLGILIGVAAVIAMLALGTGAQKSLEAQLASMGSNLLTLRAGARRAGGVATEAGASARFTVDDARAIAADIPSARRVSASVSGRGQLTWGGANWNTQLQGTMPEYAPMRASIPAFGRFFTEDEDRQRARVAVVGQTIVRELFGGRNPIGENLKINRISFQVIGVLPEKGATSWRDQDDVVIMPLSTAMRRVLGKDFVDSIDIEVRSAAEMDAAQEAIRALVIRRLRLPPSQKESIDIRNMAELQSAITETSRTMSMLLAAIAAISLLVGGIGIMNIMLVSVTERTREIGLRKAIGAGRRDILGQFLIEAVVVSLMGGLLGITLGCAITLAMSKLAGWTATVSMSSVSLATLFSLSVGVAFGLWPARKASLLNPIQALRYE